jgi:hypothetical protein
MSETTVTADEMMSVAELTMLSIENRFGKMLNALDKVANATVTGANNIEALTAQVTRLADAFEAMADFIGCITESVEGADGVSRCYVRTHSTTNGILSFRDNSEGE